MNDCDIRFLRWFLAPWVGPNVLFQHRPTVPNMESEHGTAILEVKRFNAKDELAHSSWYQGQRKGSGTI